MMVMENSDITTEIRSHWNMFGPHFRVLPFQSLPSHIAGHKWRFGGFTQDSKENARRNPMGLIWDRQIQRVHPAEGQSCDDFIWEHLYTSLMCHLLCYLICPEAFPCKKHCNSSRNVAIDFFSELQYQVRLIQPMQHMFHGNPPHMWGTSRAASRFAAPGASISPSERTSSHSVS